MTDVRPEGALKAVRHSRTGRVWVDAGRLSVDLALTGPWPEASVVAARWENLHTPDDLADWLSATELRLDGIRATTDDLGAALELRAASWALIRAATGDRPRPANAVRLINSVAAGEPLVPQLGGSGREWLRPTTAQALTTIARDAVALHADPSQLARLRECASEDCPRPFYDTSRPGTRRWCDPVRCGDRQRARSYRAHRTAGAARPA